MQFDKPIIYARYMALLKMIAGIQKQKSGRRGKSPEINERGA
jgi:hypothetical protein